MTPAMANTGSDAPGGDRESSRDLLLGRIGKAGSSRNPAAPQRKGGQPSHRANDALLREILRRIEELSERAAATEQSMLETSAMLERIVPTIEDAFESPGDRPDATAALSDVLSRLHGMEEKMPDPKAAAAAAPIRQDLARLANRIGEFALKLDSRLPEEDGHDGDVLAEVRLLGSLVNWRIDHIEKGVFGIRHDIDAIDPVSIMRKRSRQPEARRVPDPAKSLAVPADAVPDGFDLEDFRATIGVVHELRNELGIALTLLDMTLPDAGRERAAADFRRSDGSRRRWPWLRLALAGLALVIAGALVEATWSPVSDGFAAVSGSTDTFTEHGAS